MFTLEALLVRHQSTLSSPMLNATAATLFLAYAVSGVEQAQSRYFDGCRRGIFRRYVERWLGDDEFLGSDRSYHSVD